MLATPVYFYSMCAQLKVMIDWICPRYTEMTGKDLYLIATVADGNHSALDGTHYRMLDCLDGAREVGILYGTGVWQTGNLPILSEACEMGPNV